LRRTRPRRSFGGLTEKFIGQQAFQQMKVLRILLTPFELLGTRGVTRLTLKKVLKRLQSSYAKMTAAQSTWLDNSVMGAGLAS